METWFTANVRALNQAFLQPNLVDAVRALATGKRSQYELSIIAIQAHWRRHVAFQHYRRQRLAAKQLEDAARRKAAKHTARAELRKRTHAIISIQAAFRGWQARRLYSKLRSRGRRRFSFRRPKKPAPQADSTAAADDMAGARPRGLMSRLSFERRQGKRASTRQVRDAPMETDAGAADAIEKHKEQAYVLSVMIAKNNRGLGLELDHSNTVRQMVAGGAAALQGILSVGDKLISVDGVTLGTELLCDVIDKSRTSHWYAGRRCSHAPTCRPVTMPPPLQLRCAAPDHSHAPHLHGGQGSAGGGPRPVATSDVFRPKVVNVRLPCCIVGSVGVVP